LTIRPGVETFILACLHKVAEGVVSEKLKFDWDRLKGYMKKILPFAEMSRKKLSADKEAHLE